jgi:predicted DNA-binding transcriptional regulator AlpA
LPRQARTAGEGQRTRRDRAALTTREVADRLGVTAETVLRWRVTRDLPSIVLTSRAIRYEETAIDASIAARTTTAVPGRESANNPDRHRRGNATLPVPTIPLPRAAQDEED